MGSKRTFSQTVFLVRIGVANLPTAALKSSCCDGSGQTDRRSNGRFRTRTNQPKASSVGRASVALPLLLQGFIFYINTPFTLGRKRRQQPHTNSAQFTLPRKDDGKHDSSNLPFLRRDLLLHFITSQNRALGGLRLALVCPRLSSNNRNSFSCGTGPNRRGDTCDFAGRRSVCTARRRGRRRGAIRDNASCKRGRREAS